MAKPITIANTFATQTGPIPLSQLDTNFSQIQTFLNAFASYANYVVDTGAVNTLQVSTTSGGQIGFSNAGTPFQVLVSHTTTISAVTILVNGSGPFNVVNSDGSALVIGAFSANQIISLVYDGSVFRWLNGASTGGGSGVSAALGTANQIAVSSATGNVTFSFAANTSIPAPTSGTALTVNGLGAAGADVTDFLYNFNADALVRLTNSNTGTSARANMTFAAGTSGTNVTLDNGSTNTPNFTINANANVGFNLNTGALNRFNITAAGLATHYAPTTGITLNVIGAPNSYAMQVTASNTNNGADGMAIYAGTSATDFAFSINNVSNTQGYFYVYGNGGVLVGSATGGQQGLGSINASALYVNGVAVGTGGAVGANPTGTIGLTAVNGSSVNFIRADGAPALSQGIVPTWTGLHTFNARVVLGAPASGVAFSVTGISGSSAAQFLATGVQVGAPTGGDQGAGTINVSGGYYTNGVALATGTNSTFTATFTGFGSNPTPTVRYSIAGNLCTLIVPGATATSNSTGFTITGLPAACQPAHAQFVSLAPTAFENNGTIGAGNTVEASFAAGSGTIALLYNSGGSNWVASGVKGTANAFSVTYSLY